MRVSSLAKLLTADELNMALGAVRYKDNFSFKVFEKPFEGLYLQILVDVPDAANPDSTTELKVYSPIPQVVRQAKGYFMDWLLERIIKIEVHEAMEFFKVNGEVWDDPHSIQP